MQRVTFNGQELYERNYNTGDDLHGKPHTLTIQAVKIETMHPQGREEQKPAIYFEKAKRPFVLGKEFAESVAVTLEEYDVAKWAGKQVTIYPVRSRNGGDSILARKAETKPVKPETHVSE